MSKWLYRVGRWAAGNPWKVIGAWLLVSVVMIGASVGFGRELEDSFEAPGLDSTAALDLLTQTQSEAAGLTAQVVVTPLDADATFFDDATRPVADLAAVQAQVEALPNVLGTNDPAGLLQQDTDAAVAAGAVSPDGSVAVIRVQYPVLEEVSSADLDRLKELGDTARATSSLQVELNGDLFFTFEESGGGGEMVGIIAAVFILLLAFGSVIAMGLPIGMALFGLALGVTSMGLVTYLIEIPSWAPEIAAMVGLGVGIDYALFLVTRHREFLALGMTVPESAGRAVATAGQAVIFAGGTVVIAILGLGVAGVPFMTAAGVATSITVLIMVLTSITLLPAFLGVSGHWINRLGVHRKRRGRDGLGTAGAPAIGARWERWGRHVTAHAWSYSIGVTALLLALTAPVLSLQLGFPGEGALPESRTERRAFDLVAEGFGAGLNGPLVIAVDISADAEVVEPLRRAIEADEGVVSVTPADIDLEAGVATMLAFPTTPPQDDVTFDTIQRLRADVIAPVVSESPATAHVGGQTASFGDIGGRVTDRLLLFIVAVVGLSFLLLTLVFRSILVPLKAAVLNLLSIGAAYGVLVMVFQWGWGKDIIGLESTVPIVAFIPMFMFAILFGLSMDYEVFLLSRVREEYLLTGDNDRSVIHGIASTARVITSAALIMISVFLGFVFGDDPIIKMMGLGLATAIFVDATIVRLVLVPATMKLMGDANWWLPGWLDRLLPTIDIEGEARLPEPEMENTATENTATQNTATDKPATQNTAMVSAELENIELENTGTENPATEKPAMIAPNSEGECGEGERGAAAVSAGEALSAGPEVLSS
jgi:putative drug exporter of the RND superfamily